MKSVGHLMCDDRLELILAQGSETGVMTPMLTLILGLRLISIVGLRNHAVLAAPERWLQCDFDNAL